MAVLVLIGGMYCCIKNEHLGWQVYKNEQQQIDIYKCIPAIHVFTAVPSRHTRT